MIPPDAHVTHVAQAVVTHLRRLSKEYSDRHLGARGYFALTIGKVSDEMVAEYIENQDVEVADDDRFKITE